MPTIVKDDLLIPPAEQTAVINALKNTTITDPWTPAIAQAVQKVDQYTARYTLTDDHYKRLVRGLTLWEAYALTGKIPDAKQKMYDEIMKELVDIRDGKFDLALATTPPSAVISQSGAWGSEDKIKTREPSS